MSSYAISVPVGSFSAQTRAGVATRKVIGSVLTFLNQVLTSKPDVYIAVEGYDAAITARDNDQNEFAKLQAAT